MPATETDKKLAMMCLQCPVCRYGRRRQRGVVFWFLKRIEGSICPACKAYERVTGRKPHEPLAAEDAARLKQRLSS